MDDTTSSAGEAITKAESVAARGKAMRAIRRCRICLGTIPVPRFRYCSEHCARKGKIALQDWRRRHGKPGKVG
jgi:hypothetical protein